ncbi:dirigent protein 11-like protein [Cinnamomum micranthum f. kanehirae]|uniref:Dirigent protein n=1 Tax=Cinnamomum micranthum f. kanehirae TaxID=337451 RepID=A0A3S3R8K7_9MAGN|nr:dirigent protein 11-like protein [Cinnamomum micranthum f. kanehirae]
MAPNTIARNGFLLLLLFTLGTLQAQAMKPKETHMSFYMHDLVGGRVTTGLAVAGTNGSKSNVLSFGTVTVLDNKLTERFHPRSSQVGRAQGIYVGSALNGQSLHFVFSIIFTNRRYNGSTLEIQGADRLELSKREVSVVSGTGLFRFARGFAVIERAFFDPVTLNAVLKFDVTLRHY